MKSRAPLKTHNSLRDDLRITGKIADVVLDRTDDVRSTMTIKLTEYTIAGLD